MTDPLNTGPTSAAPAYVSTSPGLAATFAAMRTVIAAAGIIAGLAKLFYHGQIAEAVAYLQSHDVEAAATTLAGAGAFAWGIWKKWQHSAWLAKAAADPRITWLRGKVS